MYVALIITIFVIVSSILYKMKDRRATLPIVTKSGSGRSAAVASVAKPEIHPGVKVIPNLTLSNGDVFDVVDDIDPQFACRLELEFLCACEVMPSDRPFRATLDVSLIAPAVTVNAHTHQQYRFFGGAPFCFSRECGIRRINARVRVPLGSNVCVQLALRCVDGSVGDFNDVKRTITVPRRPLGRKELRFRLGEEGNLWEHNLYAHGSRFLSQRSAKFTGQRPLEAINSLLREAYTPGPLLCIDRAIRRHFSELSSSQKLVFWSMNSYTRMLIHAVCEYYGLTHVSSVPHQHYGLWIPYDKFIEGKSLTITRRPEQALPHLTVEKRFKPKRFVLPPDLPLGNGKKLDELPSIIIALIVIRLPLSSWGALCSVSKRLRDEIAQNDTLFRLLCEGMGHRDLGNSETWREKAQSVCAPVKQPLESMQGGAGCQCDRFSPPHKVLPIK